MTNRRDVIKGGVAATAMLSAGPVLAAGPYTKPVVATHPLHSVIFDSRFADSVAFGEAARRHGLTTQAITADVTAYWYQHLDPLWRQKPVAIAGLTAHGPLFVLERLAWEKGMAVVYRGEHVPMGDGRLMHRFHGPAAVLNQADMATRSHWARQLASLVGRCPLEPGPLQSAQSRSAGNTAELVHEGLVSWVIAPSARTTFPRT